MDHGKDNEGGRLRGRFFVDDSKSNSVRFMMRFFRLIRIHIVIVVFRDLCGGLYCGLCGPEISKALVSISWEGTSHSTKYPNPNLEFN